MKTEVIKQTTNTDNTNKLNNSYTIRSKRFLTSIFFAIFILMILTQAALANPQIRAFALNEINEGEPLQSETFLFIPCKMELSLRNMDYCPDLKVLVNGIERDHFENNIVLLELKDGDVVEFDASRVLVLAEVQVSAVSRNIGNILGKSFTVTDGIIQVAKVNVKK